MSGLAHFSSFLHANKTSNHQNSVFGSFFFRPLEPRRVYDRHFINRNLANRVFVHENCQMQLRTTVNGARGGRTGGQMVLLNDSGYAGKSLAHSPTQ